MGMSQTEGRWTVERLQTLPDDGRRYEVIDGELFVTPAPSGAHQDAVLELARMLVPYAQSVALHVRVAPWAVRFSGVREVQPDLVVIPLLADGSRPSTFTELGRAALVVEVLSRGTARVDRGRKRLLYGEEDVGAYWIVDLDARCVERWGRGSMEAEVCRSALAWQPVSDCDALVIDLVRYFGLVV